MHKNHLIEVPEGYDFESAAAVTEVWATAYQILYLIADIKASDIVLVHAAASGVGTAMLQLIKAAGARSIAVASTDAKLEYCKTLGADFVINYKEHSDF